MTCHRNPSPSYNNRNQSLSVLVYDTFYILQFQQANETGKELPKALKQSATLQIVSVLWMASILR
jgi:hypothetical protein